jgi:adenine/guanine phosphoribosyltransferase-like PRPP-binding protein
MLSAGSRISDLKYKLSTIELLNLAKNYYTYRELSQIVALPETVLSRYVKGHVLPTMDRALYINKTLQKIMRLEAEVQQRLHFDESGYFDGSKLTSDTLLLERAVQHAINTFAGTRITKVLSTEDGVPLASLLAHRLGVKLVIAKSGKEVGIREYFEETYIPNGSGIIVSLYVPRDAFRRGDGVLTVDNVIGTGETQMALARIVQRAKGEVIGVYALVSYGTDSRLKVGQVLHCPIEIVYCLGEKPLQRI